MYNYCKPPTSSKTVIQSPKTPTVQKKKPIIIESYNHSQNEVQWSDSPVKEVFFEDSPRENKKNSSYDSDQTPVRIIKRYISSPQFNVRASGLVRRLDDLTEDENSEAKPKKNKRYNFDLFDDFDFESRYPPKRDRYKFPTPAPTPKPESPVKAIDFDDSFDDAILNSIPLDEISKQLAGASSCNVDIFIDTKSGLSQVVKTRNVLPRYTSDPFKDKNDSASHSSRMKEVKKPFERHNSLPASPKTNTIVTKSPTENPAPTLCTKAEIAEKRRQALERLAKTRALQSQNAPACKRPDPVPSQSQQPPEKRFCTKQEIEEKRRKAMELLAQSKLKKQMQNMKK